MDQLQQHSMGEAFLKVSQFFKFYSLYANNHEHALATLMVSSYQTRVEKRLNSLN